MANSTSAAGNNGVAGSYDPTVTRYNSGSMTGGTCRYLVPTLFVSQWYKLLLVLHLMFILKLRTCVLLIRLLRLMLLPSLAPD